MKKLDFIQALRGIAAMLVVLYHFRTYINFSFLNLGSFLFDSGSIGVDLFFMISGFIMVYTTHDKKTGVGEGFRFIIKRLIRIVPLYWICTILFMLFTNGAQWLAHSASWNWMSTGLFFTPMDLHASGPFFGYAPLFTGWTLNYEMLFYMIFGISFFFKRFRWIFFVGIFIVLTIVIPLSTHSFSLNPYENSRFYLPIFNFLTNPILFDFLIGVGVGFVFLSSISIKNKLQTSSLLILSILIFLTQYFTGFRSGHGITQYGISCALILLSSILFFKENAIAIPKWMVFLGDISYSLYITHLVVLACYEGIMTKMNWNGEIQNQIFFLLLIALVIFFSHITSTLIEKRLGNYLNRIFLKGSK